MWRLRTDGEVKPTVHNGLLHGPIPTIEPEALLRTRTEASRYIYQRRQAQFPKGYW